MNKKPNEKPIFLYIVIGILTVAVIALAAVSFLSLNHLVTLQQKVQTLSKTVEEISTDANTLISQADQLDELREQESSVKAATGETSPAQSESAEPSSESEQQNGTLSPSSNNTFTDNTDSSMDNLLKQVQSLLPADNGTWSVYVCNLPKDSEGMINDTPMQAASLIKLYIMEPDEFTYREKWLLLTRMIPLVENNFNLCELGPRSTGKSHLYKEISPNSILISGGQTTVANLFYNMGRKTVGLVGLWDCVAFDEVAGIKFKDKDGIQIMKDYMASGSFARGKEEKAATASLVIVEYQSECGRAVENIQSVCTFPAGNGNRYSIS